MKITPRRRISTNSQCQPIGMRQNRYLGTGTGKMTCTSLLQLRGFQAPPERGFKLKTLEIYRKYIKNISSAG